MKMDLQNFLLVWCFIAGCGVVILTAEESDFEIPQFQVSTLTQSFENGKKRMQEMIERSKLPVDGGVSCWKLVLSELETGCQLMSEDTQSRLALSFTSCFNEMIGFPPIICEMQSPVKECLKSLDPSSRSTFREYFLHTQDMCYYLRQEIWQDQTNQAVNRLNTAANDVTIQLYEQKFIQEEIQKSQQESLKVQSNLKKDNEDLVNHVTKVKGLFNDFAVTARKHQLVSTEIFDKLSHMQRLMTWIQGEMSLLDMVFFYFGVLLFGYLATSTARTHAARFWLILLFMATIFTESTVFNYLTNSYYASILNPEDVQWYIWLVRKIAVFLGACFIVIAAAIYRDPHDINNRMLMNMNASMQQLIEMMRGQEHERPQNERPIQAMEDGNAADVSSDEDSFSDYDEDDDETNDNLDEELRMLNQDDSGNEENIHPAEATRSVGSFGRLPNDQNRLPMFRPYNLRERSTPKENPMVQQESATQFARAVKRRRTPAPSSTTTTHRPTNYFSSDDDDQEQ